MYFRNFSVALASTLVASGAYLAYRGGPSKITESNIGTASNSAIQARGISSSSNSPAVLSSSSATEDVAQATRKALVVDGGQIYTGTITGDGPLQKTTDDYGRKVLEMVTPEQATQRIRRNQESYIVGRGKGVLRYDVVQLASNDPIEDDHAESIIEVPQNMASTTGIAASTHDWMFWGVFDGHSGWTTSAKLRQALISFVARELNSTYASAQSVPQAPIPTQSSIDAAIKRGFLALDHSIVHDSVSEVFKSPSKSKAATLLAPALSGSCALLSFYDSASKTLRVACTGDSRAVLGRRSAKNSTKWIAMPLSVDQTGDNEDEVARLRQEHPGEPGVVRHGRILGGLQPTRAFGDASYKWGKEVQARIKREFFGRSSNSELKTPPYVTAEPVVTTTKVQPETGDFVVMATDGLWEMLTNEEVIGLVGQWLEKHPEAQRAGNQSLAMKQDISTKDARADSWLSSWFSPSQAQQQGDLPVQAENSQEDKTGQRAPIRQQQWGLAPTTSAENSTPSSSRFVVEDNNVATHLIRNALGGGDRDMVCALLTLPSPYSRRYRFVFTPRIVTPSCSLETDS